VHRIKKDALFLIDGSSLLYRSYYGLKPLRTTAGIQHKQFTDFAVQLKSL